MRKTDDQIMVVAVEWVLLDLNQIAEFCHLIQVKCSLI